MGRVRLRMDRLRLRMDQSDCQGMALDCEDDLLNRLTADVDDFLKQG